MKDSSEINNKYPPINCQHWRTTELNDIFIVVGTQIQEKTKKKLGLGKVTTYCYFWWLKQHLVIKKMYEHLSSCTEFDVDLNIIQVEIRYNFLFSFSLTILQY